MLFSPCISLSSPLLLFWVEVINVIYYIYVAKALCFEMMCLTRIGLLFAQQLVWKVTSIFQSQLTICVIMIRKYIVWIVLSSCICMSVVEIKERKKKSYQDLTIAISISTVWLREVCQKNLVILKPWRKRKPKLC